MLKKEWKRLAAALMAAAMLAGTLAGCGGQTQQPENEPAPAATETEPADAPAAEETPAADSQEADVAEEPAKEAKELSYTWLIDMGEDEYYQEYEDGPVQKYWMSKTWDVNGEPKKVTVDFSAPIPGSESDYVNTLLATGEYPDVMSIARSSEGIVQLYEEGIALDLTDYIDQYMPNYKKRLEESSVSSQLYTNINGEKKILQLYDMADRAQDPWSGYIYRRDWIVKYGKNPETGEAFTGGFNDDGDWEDDVVFPSGNADPIYISDWEWMFEIFDVAMEALNITDGYAFQLFYMGVIPLGDFSSGFGGAGTWYIDEDGKCQYGATNDGMRACLECLKSWYEKGWINVGFEENTSDAMFWAVDSASVYSGKVGCCYGMVSAIGNQLEIEGTEESSPLHGIYYTGAAQPINDVYGDASVQGIEPFMYFANGAVSTGAILTNKLEGDEERIGAILTAVDYLYSDEGSLLGKRGFSDKQQAELQDSYYKEWGLDDGAYTIDEDGVVVENPVLKGKDTMENACRMIRVPGITLNNNFNPSNPKYQADSVEQWAKYPNSGTLLSVVTSQLSSDAAQEQSTRNSGISTIYAQMVPEFIVGTLDIENDADWQSYVDAINAYDPEAYCAEINAILGE